MSNTDESALMLATQAAKEIGPVIWDSLVAANIETARNLRGMGLEYNTNRFLYPLTTRSKLSQILSSNNALPYGWEMKFDGNQMGRLSLHSDDIELRLLKERATYPGKVPPAGRNHARRAWYIQDPLTLDIPGIKITQHFLLLWDYKNVNDLEEGVTLRLVMTEGTGNNGNAVPLRASLTIDNQFRNADITEKDFIGDPEIENFFQATLDEVVTGTEN